MGFLNRLMHGWNAFNKTAAPQTQSWGNSYGASSFGTIRPDRSRARIGNDKSIISSVYNQIAIDVAAIGIEHVRIDRSENDRYLETIPSALNNCLNLEANIDESSRAFKQNIVLTMFDKGVIAIVPVDTDLDPSKSNSFVINTMRVGEIVAWFPEHVRVLLYNDKTGNKEELTLEKRKIAIVENPLYSVMNEPNSTLQRLIRKLSLLDSIDEQVGSGKLDLIIQLPYVIKSEARRQQAEERRSSIEEQLKGSAYGIAYTDGTERITQLNRPAENNMLKQVEFLTAQLYSQLGLTEAVFSGTADEKTMINYYNRTVEPIMAAISQALERSFLTQTARTQGQAIRFFRDPFKLLTITDVADLSDKLIRNQVIVPNEFRSVLGMKPSKDPKANTLGNPNMPNTAPVDPNVQVDPNAPVDPNAQTDPNVQTDPNAQATDPNAQTDPNAAQDAMVNGVFDSLQAEVNKMLSDSGVG